MIIEVQLVLWISFSQLIEDLHIGVLDFEGVRELSLEEFDLGFSIQLRNY